VIGRTLKALVEVLIIGLVAGLLCSSIVIIIDRI
jgi:hypothetical protein